MNIVRCSLCKKQFSEDEVIKMGDYRICTGCRPLFLERIREGKPVVDSVAGELEYAGFWIRLVAKLLDGLVLWVVGYLLGFLEEALAGHEIRVMSGLLSLVINLGYATYFVGAYGATLGKMACGLKVVRSDGGEVSYARAFGRFWAEVVSAIILCIGYLMVAFDDQKQGLHDRICDTRVVKTNA